MKVNMGSAEHDEQPRNRAADDLLAAARGGDDGKLRQLLNCAASVNQIDLVTGFSALHYAVAKGSLPCVALILGLVNHQEEAAEEATRRSIADVNQMTSLVTRIESETRLELEQQGISIDLSAGRQSALHLALNVHSGDRAALVELLVKSGANVAVFSDRGMTPLHEACSNSTSEVIELLLSKETLALLTKSPLPSLPPPHLPPPAPLPEPHPLLVRQQETPHSGKLAHTIAIENGNIAALTTLFAFEEKQLANAALTAADGIEMACQAATLHNAEALAVVFKRFGPVIIARHNGMQVLECALSKCDGDDAILDDPAIVARQRETARRNQQRCLDFLVQQGCKAYSRCADSAGELSVRALECGIEMQREKDLDTLLRTLTPDVIADVNSAAATTHHHSGSPLLSAITTQSVQTLEKLLDTGFDPRRIHVEINELFEPVTRQERLCQRIALHFRRRGDFPLTIRSRGCSHTFYVISDNHPTLSIVNNLVNENGLLRRRGERPFAYDFLGHAIVQIGLADVLPDIVAVLLKHGMTERNDRNVCDFSPLLLLCWVSDLKNSNLKVLAKVFSMLTEAGVNCKSDGKNENFACSEMVLGAALSGSGVVLGNALAKTGTNPQLLIRDLSALKSETVEAAGARRMLRNVAGHAVRTILNFSSRASVRETCREVDRNFPAEETPEMRSPWRELYAELDRVDSLQHLSRVAVVGQLSIDPNAFELAETVQTLQLPPSIKDYLLFPDAVLAASDYVAVPSDEY